MKRFVCTALTLAMVGGLVITAFAGDEKTPPTMDPAAQQAMMQAMAGQAAGLPPGPGGAAPAGGESPGRKKVANESPNAGMAPDPAMLAAGV